MGSHLHRCVILMSYPTFILRHGFRLSLDLFGKDLLIRLTLFSLCMLPIAFLGHYFLFALKPRLWVLIRTAYLNCHKKVVLTNTYNLCLGHNINKHHNFSSKIFIFVDVKLRYKCIEAKSRENLLFAFINAKTKTTQLISAFVFAS